MNFYFLMKINLQKCFNFTDFISCLWNSGRLASWISQRKSPHVAVFAPPPYIYWHKHMEDFTNTKLWAVEAIPQQAHWKCNGRPSVQRPLQHFECKYARLVAGSKFTQFYGVGESCAYTTQYHHTIIYIFVQGEDHILNNQLLTQG